MQIRLSHDLRPSARNASRDPSMADPVRTVVTPQQASLRTGIPLGLAGFPGQYRFHRQVALPGHRSQAQSVNACLLRVLMLA
jgi:hypothetical protein